MSEQVTYRTLLFERRLDASATAVFAALADPVARAGWSAPSETAAFIYDAVDFSEGGQDVFRCGSKSNPQFTGMTTYLSIVPNHRITTSEAIQSAGEALMASLITTTLEEDGQGTHLRMIVQVTSFKGMGMIENTETGNNAALNNLVQHLGNRS